MKPQPPSLQEVGVRALRARALRAAIRAQSGLSPESDAAIGRELGALIGEAVGSGDVGKWFRGESFPRSHARLWGFAAVLGVRAGWLYFNEGLSGQERLDAEQPAHPPTRTGHTGRSGARSEPPNRRNAG